MKKFDQKLDFLRVLSMCLVVVIHICNYYGRAFHDISHTSYLFSLIINELARISVPIFFMISGALLLDKPYDEKKNRKRIERLVVTLVIFTIVYFFVDYLISGKTISNVFTLFFKPKRKMLWFLYVMIGLYIALPYTKLITDNMNEELEKRFVILWLFFNGFLYASKFFIHTGPKYLVPILGGTYYLGYFVMGHLIVKYKERFDYKKYSLWYILAIISCVSIVVGMAYYQSLIKDTYVDTYLSYRNLFMNVISISFFLLIYSNIQDKKYKIISFLSPYSFGVYLVHGLVLDFVMEFNHYKELSSIYMIPLSFLIILSISLLIVYILKKIPFIKEYI